MGRTAGERRDGRPRPEVTPQPVRSPRRSAMELKDRVVLVTGAGRGIGRAIALAFARGGAHVGLMGRTKKNLVEVQKEVRALGVRAVVLPGDVSEEGIVSRCVSACEQDLGPIDVLVNNAGIFASGPIDRFD